MQEGDSNGQWFPQFDKFNLPRDRIQGNISLFYRNENIIFTDKTKIKRKSYRFQFSYLVIIHAHGIVVTKLVKLCYIYLALGYHWFLDSK